MTRATLPPKTFLAHPGKAPSNQDKYEMRLLDISQLEMLHMVQCFTEYFSMRMVNMLLFWWDSGTAPQVNSEKKVSRY